MHVNCQLTNVLSLHIRNQALISKLVNRIGVVKGVELITEIGLGEKIIVIFTTLLDNM